MRALVTLEGLPHGGRHAVVRALMHACPGWSLSNVASEASCRDVGDAGHAQFASLMRKMRALSAASGARAVCLLSCPWFEHFPEHPGTGALVADMTRALAEALGVRVPLHVLVVLVVCADESFEQIVCTGGPQWNATCLADVHEKQASLARMDCTDPAGTPFPSAVLTVRCPPFFEENEVVVCRIAQRVVDFVSDALGKAEAVGPAGAVA
jgi:hypothetical protein